MWRFPQWRFTACLLWVGNFAIDAFFAIQLFSFVLIFSFWTSCAASCGTHGIAKGTKIARLTYGVAFAIGVLSSCANFARFLFRGTGVGVFLALDAVDLFCLRLVFAGDAVETGCHSWLWLAASFGAIVAYGFLCYFGRCFSYFTLQACTLFCFRLELSWYAV